MADWEQQPTNSMAAVRLRAELFANRIQLHNLTPLQTGYVAVAMALEEAALHLKEAATNQFGPRHLGSLADTLDRIAADTILLGNAETNESPGSDSG